MVDGHELTQHHNDGEKDAAKGEYHQPTPIGISTIILHSEETVKEFEARNEAYDKGYQNGRSQR